jgi:hypothetical protein
MCFDREINVFLNLSFVDLINSESKKIFHIKISFYFLLFELKLLDVKTEAKN